MRVKIFIFSFLFALLSFGYAGLDAYAADTPPDEAAITETPEDGTGTETPEESTDTENLVTDLSPDILAELQKNTRELQKNTQELKDVNRELDNITALLLILVVFETMRIVRSWSKGVGLK